MHVLNSSSEDFVSSKKKKKGKKYFPYGYKSSYDKSPI